LQKYLTVSAVTNYIKRKFDSDKHLKGILIQGEISNFNHHSRGHMYFTLKDENAKISAVMFKSQNRQLSFKPNNGMKVLVKGDISIYGPQGQYQIYIQEMQPDGIGALYLAYEQLKEKLEKEGLFDASRKKAIPKIPKHIAIITSPTGAAVRDIITTLHRRFPSVKRTILPVSVQGDYAAESIAKAIYQANKLNQFDTIIVGRGGGSIEELWAFNEEIVARAIYHSSIPIISAVGHETDYTISDFVADLRAPTPTAAAELSVPSLTELNEQVNSQFHRLGRGMKHYITNYKSKLELLKNAYAFKYPIHLTRQKEQQLDQYLIELNKRIIRFIDEKKMKQNYLKEKLIQTKPTRLIDHNKEELMLKQQRLKRRVEQILVDTSNQYEHKLEKLSLLNPLETMKRGYSITYNNENKIIKSTKEVAPGDTVTVRLNDGSLDCQVWGIEKKED